MQSLSLIACVALLVPNIILKFTGQGHKNDACKSWVAICSSVISACVWIVITRVWLSCSAINFLQCN